jgi:hypothetical protein
VAELTREYLGSAAGRVFVLSQLDPPIELTLESVRDVPGPPDCECFSVMFLGPAESVLPQATYRVEDEGEAFDIFIVPVGRDERGVRYEAVFNRLRKAGGSKEE